MHFHLPKPLHGWREFAGEVGIIVVGATNGHIQRHLWLQSDCYTDLQANVGVFAEKSQRVLRSVFHLLLPLGASPAYGQNWSSLKRA